MSLVATIIRVSTSVAAAPDAPRVHIGEPLGAMVPVCVATSSWPPLGILALINSTLSHAANRSAIIFHVVAPPEQHPQLVVLESMFPDATIRVVGMAANGVEDKLRSRLRALSQGAGSGRAAVGKASTKEASAKEPTVITEERIYSSWAFVYVAALFPKLRRLLWLEPNTLVRTDLHTLWRQPLRGMPVGAVADCESPVEGVVNASLMTMARSPRVAPRGCGFDTGVLLVDLLQWAATDVTARTEGCMLCAVCMCTARTPHVHHVQAARTGCTHAACTLRANCVHTLHVHAQARVEYWVSQYLRTPGELFYASGAFPLSPRTPLLLALHRSWHAMHPRWNVFALERALLSPAEARDFERWRPAGGRLPAERAAALPRWLLTADPLGHILHFSSVRKPWDLAAPANASTGAMCASPTPHAEASSFASDGATPALQLCALAWSEAARKGASQLGWLGKDGRKQKPAWLGLGGSTSRSGGSSSAAEGRSRAKDGRDGTRGGTSGGREAKSAPAAERVSASSKAKGAESKDDTAKEPAPVLHDSCGSAGCGSAGGKGKGKRQGKAQDSARAAKDSTKPGKASGGKASGGKASGGKASGGKASPKVKGAMGKSKDKASSAKDADGEDGEDGGMDVAGEDDEDDEDGEDGKDGEGDPNPLFADESEGAAGKKHNQKDDDDTDGRKRRKDAAPAAVKSSKTGAKRKSSKNFWADK